MLLIYFKTLVPTITNIFENIKTSQGKNKNINKPKVFQRKTSTANITAEKKPDYTFNANDFIRVYIESNAQNNILPGGTNPKQVDAQNNFGNEKRRRSFSGIKAEKNEMKRNYPCSATNIRENYRLDVPYLVESKLNLSDIVEEPPLDETAKFLGNNNKDLIYMIKKQDQEISSLHGMIKCKSNIKNCYYD